MLGKFGWGAWVEFGLNLGDWTPFSSPGLSAWENHFFFNFTWNGFSHVDVLQRAGGRLIAA